MAQAGVVCYEPVSGKARDTQVAAFIKSSQPVILFANSYKAGVTNLESE
jgi:hypothetical protein